MEMFANVYNSICVIVEMFIHVYNSICVVVETILKNVGTEFGARSNSTSCWLEYFGKKYPIQTNEIFITLDGIL